MEVTARRKPFNIAIAGETNLDLIVYGLPEQMPVERELLASDFRMTMGGSSSILAHNLAVLGSRVWFSTLLGDDEMGELAAQRLSRVGLDLSRATRLQGRRTGLTLLLPHGRDRHILTYPGVMADLRLGDVDVDAVEAAAPHFHLSSLFLQTGLRQDVPGLFADLRARGLTVSLDTNDDPEDRWEGVLDRVLNHVDIFLPSEDELLRMTRSRVLEEALDRVAGVPVVVVKCGARGAVVQQGTTRVAVEPVALTPVDTIGAGDSFDAGFLHAWLGGRDAVSAAQLGAITGALSTQSFGGTEAFLDESLRAHFLAMDAGASAGSVASMRT